MDAKLKSVLDNQQSRTVTMLSSLIAVQLELGYLPPEAMPAVAEYTGESVNDVWGVATFYTHFRFEPPGRHAIELCWGPSCQLFHAKRLMAVAEEFAGIARDGTNGKPVVAVLPGQIRDPKIRIDNQRLQREFDRVGVLAYTSLRRACSSLARFVAYHRRQESLGGD
ncbi:MAG: NAD(P)H-dependent oxidoreductase subunit E [Chloroflexi bacterium]|nr:NAD(P)H-dependent oxidoreductase subunit E [Chloroflexota bacterium]